MRTFASLMDFSQSSLSIDHNLGFLTVDFFRGGVVSPTPNPQPGGPRLHIYIPWRLDGPVIPQAPISVAFYDMHGLQWDYSFPRSPQGDSCRFTPRERLGWLNWEWDRQDM
jgi:hypothetical protein